VQNLDPDAVMEKSCARRESNSAHKSQQMMKMPLAEHDNVVETFSPDEMVNGERKSSIFA
jgi:hypothetical protein